MDSFNNFCKTGESKYLDSIPDEIIEKMITESAKFLWERKGKRKLQKTLMRHYNLNDDGNEKSSPKENEKHAEKLVAAFKVNVTGARSNDILIGASAGSRNAVIRIKGGNIYPEQGKLDVIRNFPTLWAKFLTKLGSIPFFNEMSIEERKTWLFIHEDSYHNRKIVGDDDVGIEFLQPGKFSEKLDEEQISTLIQGNPEHPHGYWSGKEIEDMFPRKPGSRAIKHTLAMIRGFWKLSSDYEVVDKFSGETISLPWKHPGNDSVIYVLNNITKTHTKKVAKGRIKWVRPSGKRGSRSVGIQTSKESFSEITWLRDNMKEYELIERKMSNLTPAAYKSLIQKIIRFRPEYVIFPNFLTGAKGVPEKFPATITLKALIIQLLLLPGSFVPDIQRYVSGMESLFKRLGVIFVEDTYRPSEEVCTCLTAALLSQRVKTWKPSKKIVDDTLDFAGESLNTNKYWGYSTTDTYRGKTQPKPFIIETNQTAAERASALLDELRSFGGDLAMMRSVPEASVIDGRVTRPKFMSIMRCVDQHWSTGVVYFFPPKIVKEYGNNSSTPYSGVFRQLWNEVSSINPRKMEVPKTKFTKLARVAQQLYLLARQRVLSPRSVISGETYKIDCKLSPGWISAMLGVIDVGGSPPAIVTMAASDPRTLLAIRRPSRDSADEVLTDAQEEQAIRKAKLRLQSGVMMKAAKAPITELEKAIITLKGNDYTITTQSGKVVHWESLLETQIEYPIHPIIESKNKIAKMAKQISTMGTGVSKDCDKTLNKLLKKTNGNVIRRALTFISTYSVTIEMNNVSRDGGGVVHAVILDDTAVYQFLLSLSELYPGALRPKYGQPGKFVVPSGPLLWHLTSKIKSYITKQVPGVSKWKEVTDKSKRKLWKHQEDSVEEMKKNHNMGNTGTFLWLKVGLGKTLIVLSYIKWLISQKELPTYVVYTLPESAMTSVVKEIQQFSFDITLLVPLKNIKGRKFPKGVKVVQGCTPEPNRINLIASDGNLRKCEEELSKIASDALIIFDEVHKNMNDTKRTSVSLSIARLANEFIAFTGTPVVDSKTYKLVAWLKMISSFEVNTSNYLVAANDMITQPANTGVKVERTESFAVMTDSEEAEYQSLVPLSLGGTNANPMYEDWRTATEISYDACSREMVKLTNEYVASKRRVMVVAKDTKHQEVLKEMFLASGVAKKHIFVLKSQDSLYLTSEEVKKPGMDYKIVIVPIRRAEGYTLIACSVMVSSVYPSNQATRTQIEGRINRIGQKSSNVIYNVVHSGILTTIMQNHNSARSLAKALEQLSEKV